VLGFVKTHKRLTHLIIRNAGHMVPHDRPVVSQKMIEAFVESAQQGSDEFNPLAARSTQQQQQQQQLQRTVSARDRSRQPQAVDREPGLAVA
jgi:hypothetical protein